MPSTVPPPHRRRAASPDEALALARALGTTAPLRRSDVAALLDPRGHRFQRLEWLGDSLLDHVTAHHRVLVVEDGGECCAGRSHAGLVSDRDLAASVEDAGVLHLLDWRPGVRRRADLVEACVAAAWLAGGWADALAAAATLVHAAFARDRDRLLRGGAPHRPEPPCSSDDFRRAATLGSFTLEAAASVHLVAVDAGDEGELSARRHPLLAGRRLVREAGVRPPCGPTSSGHHLDHVQALVGMAQLRDGAVAAVATASGVLGLGSTASGTVEACSTSTGWGS
ncbi:hypothetical protein [Candidatus Blastococcus massiliensis]|uniref:hypothetical protein n=1 Tax=Candidatus Blastococcus massiliensis TaxID=1470358 RepID=UPI0004B61757|nr:hypothetical protein [Candidatus Blastococcus massiliensis]